MLLSSEQGHFSLVKSVSWIFAVGYPQKHSLTMSPELCILLIWLLNLTVSTSYASIIWVISIY